MNANRDKPPQISLPFDVLDHYCEIGKLKKLMQEEAFARWMSEPAKPFDKHLEAVKNETIESCAFIVATALKIATR